MIWLPILIVYLVLVSEFVIILLTVLYAFQKRKIKREKYLPKVVIMAPHAGWDEQTEANAIRLMALDYEGEYEVFFITHTKGQSGHDVSYPHLLDLAEKYPNARVLLAPSVLDNSIMCSQKTHNMITIMSDLPDDIEVVACVDADAQVRKDWLTLLIQPLEEEKIGVTFGSRFYIPRSRNLATLVEAAWVNYERTMKGYNPSSWAWGGSFTIKRKLIEQGDICHYLRNACLEDVPLSNKVKELGYKRFLVPDCIAVTYTQERTWEQVTEFTNRQMMYPRRVGPKELWIFCLLLLLPKSLIVLLSLPLLFYSKWFLLALLAPCIDALCYLLFTLSLPRWLKDDPHVRKSKWGVALATPLSLFFTGISAFYVMFKNRIVWSGVEYEITSPLECRVVGAEAVDNAS